MTLTQLKIFVAVADLGHVTRAAEALGLTQSAVSAAISALENQYEVKLFDRIGRSIRVSEAGELFLTEARAVLDRADAAVRMLRELGGLTVGHLEIAASQTIANYWLPKRLAVFHEHFPGVLLNLTISNTRDVEHAVATGAADIGFVEGTTRTPQLVLDEVDHDQLVMVASAHRNDIDDLGSTKLSRIPLVVREPGSGTREVLENLALKAGYKWQDLNIVLELPSNEAVREAVEAGAGATLISRHVIAGAIEGGALRVIDMNVPPRSYHMVRHRDRVPSAARRAFVEMILAKTDAA
ncbi:MAG: LysR family transcriptional regulator [Rhodospirillales bacterium]|nr:LysR family transcriptional regulator [Rhodospirillales bacterium]MBO6786364.1 LysR family transcriptional regulator [Rhodospirillales bacterium]